MHKLFTTRLFIIALLATTQITFCSPNNHPWPFQILINIFVGQPTETTDTLIAEHLQKLEYDLIGHPQRRVALVIPQYDVNQMKAMGKTELQNLTAEQLQNTNYVNQILGSVMQQHVQRQAESIGKTISSDLYTVQNTATAIANSFATRLEHSPNRNGQALQEFFGTNLETKVRASLLNPTYTTYR